MIPYYFYFLEGFLKSYLPIYYISKFDNLLEIKGYGSKTQYGFLCISYALKATLLKIATLKEDDID